MKKQDLKFLRKNFRESVFERDGFECVFCDEIQDLDCHHITDRSEMPNGGYVLSNGITLCKKHHNDAEYFHRTGGKSWANEFHPNDLYRIINSSHKKAYEESLKLKPHH